MFAVRWRRLVQPCGKLLLPGVPAQPPPLLVVQRCIQGSLTLMLYHPAKSALLRPGHQCLPGISSTAFPFLNAKPPVRAPFA